MIQIKPRGRTDVVIKQIKRQKKLVNGARRSALYKIGNDIQEEARQSIIRGPKTGKLYRIRGRKNRHRASAPGESPANRTGTLQRSIGFINYGSGIIIGAEAEYARFLELGTDKMAARPYLKRAIDKNIKNFREHMVVEIQKATK
jgi:HK97 gp10 family phage protein